MRDLLCLHFLLAIATPLPAQRLIGLDSNRTVWNIDMTTGARTQLGTISANAGVTGGLAYDQITGRLFTTSTSLHQVFTVDVSNWAATLIGSYGLAAPPYMHGIEWDPTTNTLYGCSAAAGAMKGLYTIDQTTGAATFVGATGIPTATNFQDVLGFDLIQNIMWLASMTTASLYSTDRATGVATLVGPLLGPTSPSGMAYNIDNQTLYLIDNSADSLYTITTATGLATVVGPMGPSNMLGLVYIPGTGRLTRAAHACGPTAITVTGHPAIGAVITTTLGGVTALPFIGYGVVGAALPFCGCTIGHEWAVATFGTTSSFTVPLNPGLVGVQLFIQGTDFLGAGGCSAPLLTLTDTITVTLG